MFNTRSRLYARRFTLTFFSFGEKHRDIGYRDAHSYTVIPKEIRSQIEKREKEEAKEAKERLKDEMAMARASATTPPRARYNRTNDLGLTASR